jgi:hypothetical protein
MEKEEAEILYGKDIHEWLKRWDEGHSVWSIEMGGLGPGYEQAIQITTVEVVKHLLEKQYDLDKWKEEEQSDKIWKWSMTNPVIKDMGLSGAQWDAAVNLACMLYAKGPVTVMLDERVKDRHIQVCKTFP